MIDSKKLAELDLNKIAMDMKVLPLSAGTIFGLTPQELGALFDELAFLRKAYPRLCYMESLELQLAEAKRSLKRSAGIVT